MGIKADVTLKKIKSNYPFIGYNTNNGRVVLFKDARCGTVLARGDSSNSQEVGDYHEYWIISEYEYIESIRLTNT